MDVYIYFVVILLNVYHKHNKKSFVSSNYNIIQNTAASQNQPNTQDFFSFKKTSKQQQKTTFLKFHFSSETNFERRRQQDKFEADK